MKVFFLRNKLPRKYMLPTYVMKTARNQWCTCDFRLGGGASFKKIDNFVVMLDNFFIFFSALGALAG